MPLKDLSYASIVGELQAIAHQFPQLAVSWTTQDRYRLPAAGRCGLAPCLVWVLELTHRPSLQRHPQRPDVLISGALHGDERVGPLATLELAKWLLGRYEKDPWARRLVHTRRLLLVPMANAYGYANAKREELAHDPNRDFPFEQAPGSCMTTIAARSLNEIVRSHLVQMAITFHGGMEAVGYVWGDFAHHRDRVASSRSPDETALVAFARAASSFAGPSHDTGRLYPVGRMNSLVYPVAGGMEDWGYAASWEGHHVGKGCRPSTHGGYPLERTVSYDNATARMAVLLVETAGRKAPPDRSLGWSIHGDQSESPRPPPWPVVAIDAEAKGRVPDGHIPRNIRLALAAVDLVRPYIHLELNRAREDAARAAAVAPAGRPGSMGIAGCLPLSWHVWGAVHVDVTQVVYAEASTQLGQQPPASDRKPLQWRPAASSQSGPGVWGNISRRHFGKMGSQGSFASCVSLPEGATRRTLLLAARATVDQAWGRSPLQPTTPASLGPQTHLARARTDPSWTLRANGREVHGQVAFLSDLALEVQCEADGRVVAGTTPTVRVLTDDAGQTLPRSIPRRRAFSRLLTGLGRRGS